MKKVLAVAALFLVTLGVALWLFGVFDKGESPPATPPSVPPREGGPGDPAVSGLRPTQPDEPAQEPAVEIPPFPSPVRVLFVTGDARRSYVQWLFQFLVSVPELSYQSRFATAPDPAQVDGTHSRGLPPLEGPPRPEDLDDARVLVLADVDPSFAPDEFWTRVAERVRAGTLGVLLLSEMQHGKALADVPALAGLVPVVAARVQGSGPEGAVAGVLATERPFAPTEAGVRHPATRLSPFPNWSRRMWESRGDGKGRWVTKFVHPVERPAEGAEVLVNVSTGKQTEAGSVVEVPAIVASAPGKGRVLWVGGLYDLRLASYLETRSHDLMRALALHWLAWLSGS